MVDLIACYWTIAGPVSFGPDDDSSWSFQARAEAAGRAGYRGIGLKHADLKKTVANHGFAEVRALIANNGLRHLELEALSDWWETGAARDASDSMRRDLLEAASLLGARHIKVYGAIPAREPPPIDRMREEFSRLVVEAVASGTIAVLEPVGCSNIPDLATALEIIGDTAGKGGALMLDSRHIVRGGIPLDEIASLRAEWIGCVEINDGTSGSTQNYLSDTMNKRLLCGEGTFDLRGVIHAVRSAGYSGPWGVEILSEVQRARPLDEAAQRSFETAQKTLADAEV